MFKAPFSFKGRIRRTEFGISYIIYTLIAVIAQLLLETEDSFSIIFAFLLYILLLWFFIAQSAKRCHDRDNSGWYQIIPFYIFWLLFAESDFGDNSYGPNPKGLGNVSEIDDIGKSED